jgi:hypothetical protein
MDESIRRRQGGEIDFLINPGALPRVTASFFGLPTSCLQMLAAQCRKLAVRISQ